jgi:hypothetical protein
MLDIAVTILILLSLIKNFVANKRQINFGYIIHAFTQVFLAVLSDTCTFPPPLELSRMVCVTCFDH